MKTGEPVELQLSEHWDVVTATGPSWIPGTILKIAPDYDYAFVTLDKAVAYAGQSTAKLLATPRYEKHLLTPTTDRLICNFIAADDLLIEQLSGHTLRQLTSWFQAIGTLKVGPT